MTTSASISAPLIGGALIGLASAALLLFNGRVCGISGIVGGLLRPQAGETGWRTLFVAGLLFGGAMLAWLSPGAIGVGLERGLPLMALAGLLVGVGTRLGSGCTSGHGVCGLGRFSKRSLVAVLTFMATGAISVAVTRTLMGGV